MAAKKNYNSDGRSAEDRIREVKTMLSSYGSQEKLQQ